MNLIERRKRKLIIFTILCILVFALFIGVLVRNGKVAAATCPACTSHPTLSAATCEKPATCPYCGYQTGSALGHTPGSPTCTEAGKCTRCGKAVGKAALGHQYTYTSFGAGQHRMTCSRCGTNISGTTEGCTYDANGSCTKCGYTKASSSGSTCEHNYNKWVSKGSDMHSHVCSKCGGTEPGSYETCTFENGACTKCGNQKAATCNHSYTAFKSIGSGMHRRICAICGNESSDTEACTFEGATCARQGTCSKCGATGFASAGHNYTTFKSIGGGRHQKACANCGSLEEGTAESCVFQGATCIQQGTCSKCGATGVSPTAHSNTAFKSIGAGMHQRVCAYCENPVPGTAEACTFQGATCTKRGTCSKCGTTGGPLGSHDNTAFKSIGVGMHKRVCANCGNETSDVEACTASTTATCTKQGICNKCGVTINALGHNWGSWKKDSSGHTAICSRCNSMLNGPHSFTQPTYNKPATCEICGFEGAILVHTHTGGTHANGGKCELCGESYQVHVPAIEWKIEYNGDGTHKSFMKCSFPDCEVDTVITKNCSGGTHDNGGNCTACGGTYQDHSYKIECKQYDSTIHRFDTVCSYPGCNVSTKKRAEEHSGGTHANGGRCTVCGYQYQNHDKGIKAKAGYKISATGHTQMYVCTFSGCGQTFYGQEESHIISKYVDNSNGTHSDVCTVCGYKVKQEHTYGDAVASRYRRRVASNNAKPYVLLLATETEDTACTACGALKSAENNGCEHSYVEKSDETQHWEECSICGYFKKDSLKEHEFTYKDNGDGTHSGTCKVCKYEYKEEHNYEDGKCNKCSTSVENCEHEYIVKNDETNHWVECSKCNDKRTVEEHTFENYTNDDGTETKKCTVCDYKIDNNSGNENNKNNDNKNNEDNNDANNNENKNEENGNKDNENKKDNTITNTIFPKTGASKVVITVITVLGILLGLTMFKLKKYKGIK